MEEFDALLLGRKTYAIFAEFWPHQEDGINGDVARMFNRIPKYVASRSKPDLSWNNSVLLGPDLPSEMARIKQQHEHIRVIGSLDFVQTLLTNRFFDTISLWVFPLTLGTGKPVFGTGTIPANLTLLAPPLAGPKGGVLLRYGRADGEPTSGDMSEVVLEG